MFQIITHESTEPVAERIKNTDKKENDFAERKNTLAIRKIKEKIPTNLFHIATEIYARHCTPVTLEMPLKGGIRLFERKREKTKSAQGKKCI